MVGPPKRPILVRVERARHGEVEADLPPAPDTLVSIHLAGRVALEWGAGRRRAAGRPARGQVTVVPRGRDGRLRVRGGPCEILKLGLPDEAFAAWAEAEGRAWDGRDLVDRFAWTDPLVEQLGLALLAESERRATVDTVYRDALSNALVAHLVRRHSTTDAPAPGDRTVHPLSEARARRSVEFMEASLAAEIGLDDIARELGLSTSHFAARFRRTFGCGPGGYLTGLRLDRAAEMLRATGRPVAEVASAVGFRSASHFSQAFRKRYGRAPTAWRDGRQDP